MIYKITGNPTEPYWAIQGLHYPLQTGLKLGVVYDNPPLGSVAFLDDTNLKLGDDIIIELLRQGKALIQLATMEETSQQYWLDELGKVML